MKDDISLPAAINKAKKKSNPKTWMDWKKQAIVKALLDNDGHPVAAARQLGITRNTMWVHMSKLGLIEKQDKD
jgi:transcriptional regulator of acetoin/glycerol metabolism